MMADQVYTERPGSASQEGFGSWLAFGEQSDYNTPLTGWHQLWQKKYEFISSGIRYDSTPIVPGRVRASRSPIPNIRGRAMVAGALSFQSHIRDMLPIWKEATMTTKAQAKDTSGDTAGTKTVAADALYAAATVGAEESDTSRRIVPTNAQGFIQPDASTGVKDGNCPARITITFANSPVAKKGSDVLVGIFGTDQNDQPISEVLTFNTTDGWAQTTTKFFKKIGVHPFIGQAGEAAGTGNLANFRRQGSSEIAFSHAGIQIHNLNPDTATVKVDTANSTVISRFDLRNPILNGNTFFVQKGNIPNSYIGCIFNSTTFQFGETCQIDVDVIGRNGLARVPIDRQNLYGMESGRVNLAGPADAGGSDSTAWNFAAIEEDVNPGWEGGILLKEHGDSTFHVIPCTDISFVINNNLSHPERYWFNRYHVKPTATEVREVMANATVDYKTAQGLDYQFLENLNMEAKIIAYSKPAEGRQYKTEITCPRVQLNSAVDPEVSDNGPITQSFDLKCVPTTATAGDEATIEVFSDQTIASLE